MTSMTTLLAIPILGILLVLQSAIFSQIPLLQGTTDLVLLALVAWSLQRRVRTAWQWGIIGGLLVGFVSAVPFFVYVVGYLLAVGFSLLLRQRIWQVPLLAMFIATFFGTLVIHLATLVALAGVRDGIADRRLDQPDHPAKYFIELTVSAAFLYTIQRSGELPVS